SQLPSIFHEFNTPGRPGLRVLPWYPQAATTGRGCFQEASDVTGGATDVALDHAAGEVLDLGDGLGVRTPRSVPESYPARSLSDPSVSVSVSAESSPSSSSCSMSRWATNAAGSGRVVA